MRVGSKYRALYSYILHVALLSGIYRGQSYDNTYITKGQMPAHASLPLYSTSTQRMRLEEHC